MSKRRRIVQDFIRQSVISVLHHQFSKIMQHEATKQNSQEVKLKDQPSNLHHQQYRSTMLVQPGDAQQHMLNALSAQTNEIHNYNPYQFSQMDYALSAQNIRQLQLNLHPDYTQQTNNNQNTQEATFIQPHFQEFIPQSHSYHSRGHRGRGRHHGKHHNHFYQYNRHHNYPPYHNNGYQYYPDPPFYGNPPQNFSLYPYGIEYTEHCQNTFQLQPQSMQPCKADFSERDNTKHKKRWKNTCKNEDKGYYKGKWKNRSQSPSKSSSSSDENQDDESYFIKKKYNQEISEFYKKKMKDFFQAKQINEPQRQKIMRVLMNRFPRFDAPIDKIIKAVEYLQSQNLLFHLAYAKVIKVSLNNNFDFNAIVPRLAQIQQRKIKKLESDEKIKASYGEEIEPMIDHHVLINQTSANVVFLVDGNNIMPAIKHFRHYFHSRDHRQKLETQIRLRFFISIALPPENVWVFFDEKFDEAEAKQIESDWLQTNCERQRFRRVPTVYGQTEIADQKIVKKVRELSDGGHEQEVILVSSDRQLFMRCKQIMKLRHTGGKFFFKFLKFKAKQACKGDKQGKRTCKTILHGLQ